MADQTLKHSALGKAQVRAIAGMIELSWDGFDSTAFVERADTSEFHDAGILKRGQMLASLLQDQLPKKFEVATEILLAAMRSSGPPASLFGSFLYSPFSYFVTANGLSKERLDRSLETLGEMTMFYSSELAVRPFIYLYPEKFFEYARVWAADDREQIRRLASESLRPYLPWAKVLHLPSRPSLEILHDLRNDESEFVLRSVGNHLNDMSRLDPTIVLETLSGWRAEGWSKKQQNLVTRLAVRTLLKAGSSDVFAFLGLPQNIEFEELDCALSESEVTRGSPVTVKVRGLLQQPTDIYVDARVLFPSQNGEALLGKVFFLKRLRAKSNREFVIKKSINTGATATRKVGLGPAFLEVRINGVPTATLEFKIAASFGP